MTHPFVSRLGGVLSADIAVPEHAREQQFYARVLGTGDAPLWRDDLMNNHGTPIIGLGAQTPEYAALPMQWMPHIQVADIAASVARAVALGGQALMHDKDDAGRSQWAVLQGPDGEAFGLIPQVPAAALPSGDAAVPPLGHIAWLDLTVEDAEASRDFYGEVIGWTPEAVTMGGAGEAYADYNMLAGDGDGDGDGDGEAVAGICHARGPNTGLPAVWMLVLPVGDLVESLAHVRSEGGTVIKEDHNAAGEPTGAVIRDPLGVHLALAAE